MQTFQVSSPAEDFFTSLRRYPNMRSEVEVSMRGLRAALGGIYKAAHGVCERLVKMKVNIAKLLFLSSCKSNQLSILRQHVRGIMCLLVLHHVLDGC